MNQVPRPLCGIPGPGQSGRSKTLGTPAPPHLPQPPSKVVRLPDLKELGPLAGCHIWWEKASFLMVFDAPEKQGELGVTQRDGESSETEVLLLAVSAPLGVRGTPPQALLSVHTPAVRTRTGPAPAGRARGARAPTVTVGRGRQGLCFRDLMHLRCGSRTP